MNIVKIMLVIVSVALIGAISVEVLTYFFGADKVFFIALFSIPFIFVWCLLTDKDIEKKRNLEIE